MKAKCINEIPIKVIIEITYYRINLKKMKKYYNQLEL